jgi:hypothetical protein
VDINLKIVSIEDMPTVFNRVAQVVDEQGEEKRTEN